jgi:hypothetical protein
VARAKRGRGRRLHLLEGVHRVGPASEANVCLSWRVERERGKRAGEAG